ncbi:MAG: ABC transporter permease [Bacteroidota bacterium]
MFSLVTQLRLAFVAALRSFRKNLIYSSLNLLGLALAFTTLILVAAFVWQESSYESFHQQSDRMVRVTYQYNGANGFEASFARVPINFINELPGHLPEVEKLIRLQNQEDKYLRVDNNRYKPEYAWSTDADIFQVFDLPLIAGDTATALSAPNSIVLSEQMALKYFGRTDVLGAELFVNGEWSPEEVPYKVTGVMRDLPVNTHLPMNVLLSFRNETERRGWAYIYLLLKEGADIASVEAAMPGFISEHTEVNDGNSIGLPVQALSSIHLQSKLAREIKPGGQLIYLRIFMWVGLFVWLVALINFANLSTALAMKRGREMGVRQVLGASKSSLFIFSLLEAMVNSLLALGLGAVLAWLLFPAFGQLTGVQLLPPIGWLALGLIGLALLSGIVAGILPAMVLTSVKLLQVLKGGNNWSMKANPTSSNIKRLMISLQFGATIILMGSAVVAYQQFQFINEKNLRLQPEQIIAIPEVPGEVTNQYGLLKNRLQQLPGVRSVAACMQMPSSEIRDVGPVRIQGVTGADDNPPMMDMQIIDPDFTEMMQLELLAGADFSRAALLREAPAFTDDYTVQQYLAETPRQYLINETAMKQLGWNHPSDAIGQSINWSIGNFELAYGEVTGVIKDYHQETLRNTIDPLLLTMEPIWFSNFMIKVETSQLESTIKSIQQLWEELFPFSLEYQFMDQLYQQLYHQDRVQLQLLSILALVAVFISFLGLVSLVAYALKRRSRELAIRRVIGAELHHLTSLIGKEYFFVLLLAAVFAIPISYRGVNRWLDNFAYRIDIPLFAYGLTFGGVLLLLLLTITFQTWRATIDNPVKSLREE